MSYDKYIPGISSARAAGGIASQSFNTTYQQIKLTNTVDFETPEGIIETTYPGGMDSVEVFTLGLYKFTAVFYVEGSNNKELFFKSYLNGVEVAPGDPAGIQLLGNNKPTALPFTGWVNVTSLPAVFTYYARGDKNGSFEIKGGNATWEKTDYTL